MASSLGLNPNPIRIRPHFNGWAPTHLLNGLKESIQSFHRRQFQRAPEEEDTEAMVYIAMIYQEQGKVAAAIALYQSVLTIGESGLTDHHPDVCLARRQLALLRGTDEAS